MLKLFLLSAFKHVCLFITSKYVVKLLAYHLLECIIGRGRGYVLIRPHAAGASRSLVFGCLHLAPDGAAMFQTSWTTAPFWWVRCPILFWQEKKIFTGTTVRIKWFLLFSARFLVRIGITVLRWMPLCSCASAHVCLASLKTGVCFIAVSCCLDLLNILKSVVCHCFLFSSKHLFTTNNVFVLVLETPRWTRSLLMIATLIFCQNLG